MIEGELNEPHTKTTYGSGSKRSDSGKENRQHLKGAGGPAQIRRVEENHCMAGVLKEKG